jgi:hypothetical protein
MEEHAGHEPGTPWPRARAAAAAAPNREIGRIVLHDDVPAGVAWWLGACARRDRLSTMMRGMGMSSDAEDQLPWRALKKQRTPKRWRSKEAKEVVAAVQRAGGQVERTASGHLKVIGPTGSAIVASAPNAGRAGGRAVHNTLATIRSKTGLQV